MSALVANLPLVPVLSLQRVGLRARPEWAERAVDGVFTRRASLELDRRVLALERARRREKTGRGHRWAA